MDESELRRVAAEVRDLVAVLVGEPDAARVTAAIDAALALPAGRAKRALRRALAADERVHAWVLDRIGRVYEHDRLAEPVRAAEMGVEADPRPPVAPSRPAPAPPPRYAPTAGPSRYAPAPAPSEAAPAAGPPSPPRPRLLLARMPDRVETGRRLSLVVAITLAPQSGATSAVLKDFLVPPEGLTVTVLVSSPGLVPRGDREADIHVPVDADSEPVRFSFDAGPVGLHPVLIEVFRDGTFLGSVGLQVSVEPSVATTDEREHVGELTRFAVEPGEVTLQVRRGPEGYRFQLIGDALYGEVTALMGDATDAVSRLAGELRAMAAKKSKYTSAAAVRKRVRQLGIGLWSAAVPEAVQQQFWKQAGRITTFTIAAENDTIPWELLYPRDAANDNGFLAEQFPVVRRVYGAPRVATLPMGSAAYVVPPGSPRNALDEVDAIRAGFGSRLADRGTFAELSAMDELVLDSPGLLHFACHNAFSDEEGSSIALDGGPWTPTDLSDAMAQRAMATASPLVFLNACRTAGESDWFSQMNGWARGFVDAGAGAFVGTLWAVRSSSARTYAEAFYRQFVGENQTLGTASLLARRAIAEDDGDPTWLAYSIYGNPAARAAGGEGTRP